MYIFKYSDMDYDAYYDNEHCRKENEAIQDILRRYVKDGDDVLDLGAGTGLVCSMIGERCNTVIQVESDPKMIEQNPYTGMINVLTLNEKAEKFLRHFKGTVSDVITCLFAVNYMNPLVLFSMLKRSKREVVLLAYKRPYTQGSTSVYAGRMWMFLARCGVRKILLDIVLWMNRKRVVERHPLMGEPYYDVIVLRK